MEVEIDLAFVCSVELQRRLHNEIKINNKKIIKNNNKKIIKNNNNKIIIRLRLRLRHEAVFFAYFFKKMIRHSGKLNLFFLRNVNTVIFVNEVIKPSPDRKMLKLLTCTFVNLSSL